MEPDFVYWAFWIVIGVAIGIRARRQTLRTVMKMQWAGIAFVVAGVLMAISNGFSVGQAIVFDRQLSGAAGIERYLLAFGYTLIFSSLLLRLRGVRRERKNAG